MKKAGRNEKLETGKWMVELEMKHWNNVPEHLKHLKPTKSLDMRPVNKSLFKK